MKKTHFSGWLLLIMLSVAGCKSDDDPSAETSLAGDWSGNTEVTKAGDCDLGDAMPIKTEANWQVTGEQVTGRLSLTIGTTTVTTQLNGTIDGNTVRLSQTSKAVCNGVPRDYESRYEGKIDGKVLTLAARDTVCPTMNCIFVRTMRLTKK